MSFWTGFAKALDQKSERMHQERLLTGKRAYERDEWNRQFKMKRQAAVQDMIAERYMQAGGTSGSGGGGGSGGSSSSLTKPEIEAYTVGLVKRFGVPQDVVTTMMSTGNPTFIKQAYEELDKKYTELTKDWDDDVAKRKLENEVLGPMLETMIVAPPQQQDIFGEGFKDYISTQFEGQLPPDLAEMLGAKTTVPGAVLMSPGVVRPKPDIGELNQRRDYVKERVVPKAINRQQEITNKLASITAIIESGKPDENELAVLGREAETLANELTAINQALEAADKENLVPITNLFGGDAEAEIDEYLPQFRGAPSVVGR